MKTLPRVSPRVVRPLKQFGSLWVEVIELDNPENGRSQQYDFVWMQHTTVRKKHELRLAWIRLAGGYELPTDGKVTQ